MKNLILSLFLLSFSFLPRSEELYSKDLSGFILIPNISINSFESYDKFYLDLSTGYKAYLSSMSSDFKAVIIRKLSSDSFTTLEVDDNYLNPNSIYVKLGFGVNL